MVVIKCGEAMLWFTECVAKTSSRLESGIVCRTHSFTDEGIRISKAGEKDVKSNRTIGQLLGAKTQQRRVMTRLILLLPDRDKIKL